MRTSVTLLVLVLSCASMPSICTAAGDDTDGCGFYEDWLEEKLPCGAQGYALDYGQYYCRRFTARIDRFSATGSDWMVETRACLQTSLRDLVEGREARRPLTCDELQRAAIDSHLGCYTQGTISFCDLRTRDLLQVVKVLEAKDAFSREGLQQVKKFAHFCLLHRRAFRGSLLDAKEKADIHALENLIEIE